MILSLSQLARDSLVGRLPLSPVPYLRFLMAVSRLVEDIISSINRNDILGSESRAIIRPTWLV